MNQMLILAIIYAITGSFLNPIPAPQQAVESAKIQQEVSIPTSTPTEVPTATPTETPIPTSTPFPTIKILPTATPVYQEPRSFAPVGASAICNDGTYSYSQHRRGTCSHHGGVAVWL